MWHDLPASVPLLGQSEERAKAGMLYHSIREGGLAALLLWCRMTELRGSPCCPASVVQELKGWMPHVWQVVPAALPVPGQSKERVQAGAPSRQQSAQGFPG